MQEDAAHELRVEGAQAQRAARRLAAVGERLGQQVVELPRHRAPAQRLGAGDQAGIVQRLELRLQRAYARHERPDRLDLAVVGGAEDPASNGAQTKHVPITPDGRDVWEGALSPGQGGRNSRRHIRWPSRPGVRDSREIRLAPAKVNVAAPVLTHTREIKS